VAKSASSSKKSTKPAAKKPAKPKASKPAAAPKKAAKPAPAKKPSKPAKAPAKPAAKVAPKPAAPVKPAPVVVAKVEPAPAIAGDRPKPKGITIVSNKPMKRPKPVKKILEMPSLGAPLLGGNKKWKPLIPSGPNARATDALVAPTTEKPKSPFAKKELDRYREILLKKRHELVGDITNLEGEALNANSGSLSHTPQHIAEQGTESFDQALSLDIAQADRNLIKEIDDALNRIAKGSFGICELTHKPISKDRLEELPWTRHSIEAARELERREFIRP
jgi:RNA polymerase-binding transcription factor DksA